MRRWRDFAAEKPELAEAGRALFYQFRVGLGYLATVRADGAPRLHPVCPVIAGGGLYVFVGNHSPKLGDLLRDGRFALHTFPKPDLDDEFYVAGHARRVDDADVRKLVYETYTATGAFTSDDTLFELWLERALHAKYEARPSWPPTYTKWRAATRLASEARSEAQSSEPSEVGCASEARSEAQSSQPSEVEQLPRRACTLDVRDRASRVRRPAGEP